MDTKLHPVEKPSLTVPAPPVGVIISILQMQTVRLEGRND